MKNELIIKDMNFQILDFLVKIHIEFNNMSMCLYKYFMFFKSKLTNKMRN